MQSLGTLFTLRPPYEVVVPAAPPLEWSCNTPGTAIVWHVNKESIARLEFDHVCARPRGTPLALVLPHPTEIADVSCILPRLYEAAPRAILPDGPLASPQRIRAAMAGVPRHLPRLVTEYLTRHNVIGDKTVQRDVLRIFQLAPKVHSISALSRELYLSRRTLGRHFEAQRLPVPSHWLQFARLLNVLLRSQNERLGFVKLAVAAGYPDGFTFSNQSKRLIGWRPSQVRNIVGFEWLIEAWLLQEQEYGRFADGAKDDSN